MTSAASARPPHGARSTVGGGLADWLIGTGILALLVAAFGMWGLPLLSGPAPVERQASASAGPAALAPASLAEEGPLPELPGIEAPVPPDAAPPAARRSEALRPEVAGMIEQRLDAPAIEAARADAFVGADQVISLPARPATRQVSVQALAERLGNDPAAEVTVRREVVAVQPRRLVDLLQQAVVEEGGASVAPRPLEQIARDLLERPADADDPAALAHLSRVLSAAGIDPMARFTVEMEGGTRELPLAELVGLGQLTGPEATIDVVERSESLERVSLASLEADGTGMIEVVEPGATSGPTTTTIGELLGSAAGAADTLYYVRTVQPGDGQGVWGIVQRGVTETFARGVRLGEGTEVGTVTLAIPDDADELEGRRSSFLGQLIARKVDASWVYNLGDGRMDRNPHLVYPGQELVIVGFTPAELNDIHAHFSSTRD